MIWNCTVESVFEMSKRAHQHFFLYFVLMQVLNTAELDTQFRQHPLQY
jgi:hypothetical protein